MCMLSFLFVEGDLMAPVVIPIRSRLRPGSRSASLTTLEESLDTGRIPDRRMRDQRRRFPLQSPNGQEARDVVVAMGEPGRASSRTIGPAVQITDPNDVLGRIPGHVEGCAGRSRQPVHQDFQTQGDEMEKDCGAVAREMAALLHERLLRARDGIVGAPRPEGTDAPAVCWATPPPDLRQALEQILVTFEQYAQEEKDHGRIFVGYDLDPDRATFAVVLAAPTEDGRPTPFAAFSGGLLRT